jgi:hypothetical protein
MKAMLWTVYIALAACSNQTGDSTRNDKMIAESASTARQLANAAAVLPLMQKEDLTQIYTQAIQEFILAAYQNDKTTFDTLYFGKHVYGQAADFPDISLPETIEKTHIRLVTPELGQKKQQASKSAVYINMMGWVEQDTAEFMLIVFSNGFQHQYDYFIKFTRIDMRNGFQLAQIQFERYRLSKGQKRERITLYKDGKYVDRK